MKNPECHNMILATQLLSAECTLVDYVRQHLGTLFMYIWIITGADLAFPVWGANPLWGQPPTQVPFGKRMQKMTNLVRLGRAEIFICRSATDRDLRKYF